MPGISTALKTHLEKIKITSGMPGYKILEAAALLPPTPGATKLYGDSDSAALLKVMKSFYTYGRSHFSWTTSSSSAGADGGMMKGGTTSGACGAFNANFRWLAEHALQIMGWSNGQYIGQFMTQPSSVCIDAKWVGNVCQTKDGYATTKSYKFKDHYWQVHGGTNYDVCFNHTFGSASNIIWSTLSAAPKTVLDKSGWMAADLYKLDKPVPAGSYLLKVKDNAYGSWPNWQIFQEAQIPKKGK